MSNHGKTFQATITAYDLVFDPDTDTPIIAVDLELRFQATDPANLRDTTWLPLEKPETVKHEIWITEKQLGKKLLPMQLKAIGCNGDPADLVEGTLTIDPVGRTVVVATDELAPVNDPSMPEYDPNLEVPDPRYRLLWALSSGKRERVSDDVRARAAAALRRSRGDKPKEQTQSSGGDNDGYGANIPY